MPRHRRLAVLVSVLFLNSPPAFSQTLPGTRLWEDTGDPAAAMVEGMHTFLDRELKASVERRQAHWKRDLSSKEAYLASIAPNRARFRTIIGAVGERVAPV